MDDPAIVLRKIWNRLPGPLREAGFLKTLKDRFRCRNLLNSRGQKLAAARAICDSPETLLQFCKGPERPFEAHQIPSEILGLLAHLTPHQLQTVVEIGTAEGGTSFLLSQALPTVEHFLGIDLFVWNTDLLLAFNRSGCRLDFINAPSAIPSTVARGLKILENRPIDFLLIDGDHRYDGVRADFLAWRDHVRPGGWIAFHDIVPDERTRSGRDTGNWAGDVPRFWKEIKGDYEHYEFIDNPDQDGFGIGLLRMPAE